MSLNTGRYLESWQGTWARNQFLNGPKGAPAGERALLEEAMDRGARHGVVRVGRCRLKSQQQIWDRRALSFLV